MFPTFFDMYIDKLEEEDYIGPTLANIAINHLLYANDIVLMARIPYDLRKQLSIVKDFYNNIGLVENFRSW